MPLRLSGHGSGLHFLPVDAAVVADLLLFGVELHQVAGRDGEPEALAGLRMLAGRNPFHVGAQARLLDVLRELLERRRRIDAPAHVVHARFVGFTQHDAVMIVLVPRLEEDALCLVVTRGLNESKHVPVVLQRRFQLEDANRHVSRTQYAS